MSIRNFSFNWIRSEGLIIITSLLTSTVFLLICTKSSPLYPFNDWTDANIFFTMGKSMMNGVVLYKEIVDQKGPLLFLLHGLAYLISNKTFLGVFILEVLMFTVFLFYSYKIISLYLEKRYALISLPLIAYIILNVESFQHGDSTEELCIPLLMISLYYLLFHLKNRNLYEISPRVILVNGILAGSVLLIKFSLLGFWFGWMMVVFISMVIKRQWKQAIMACAVFLGGMFLTIIPWLFYFGLNAAIKDWYDIYFLLNMKYYPSETVNQQLTLNFISIKDWFDSYFTVNIDYNSENFNICIRLLYILYKLLEGLLSNILFTIITTIGIIWLLFTKNITKTILSKIAILVPLIFLILGIYGGGRGYPYYFLIVTPYVVFGIISILKFLRNTIDKYYSERIKIPILCAFAIIFFIHTYYINHNVYMMHYNKEDLFQYKFAEIINKDPNATLLNFGTLDVGLYTTTGIVPNIKYYNKQNLSDDKYPIIINEQRRYVEEKLVDYIIARGHTDTYDVVFSGYELIKQQKQVYEGKERTYFLFKIREDPI